MENEHNVFDWPTTDPLSPNVILYGPPGTGKTYHAKNYALAALGATSPENFALTDRETVNQIYQQLSEAGRIQFVTFHQSFSYEDFIEGIKPDLTRAAPGEEASGPQLRYVLEDGIFKRLCIQACYAIHRASQAGATPLTTAKTPKLTFDELYLEFLAEQMNLLKRRIEVSYPSKLQRDIALRSVNAKGNLLLATGPRGTQYVVSRNKLRKLYQTYAHVEEIRRVSTDIRRVIGGGNPTLYWAIFNELKEFEKKLYLDDLPPEPADPPSAASAPEAAEYAAMRTAVEQFNWSALTPESLARAERFALIIDEINRGNVSQIFGELITLIEADKRGGRPEALTVQLPYSKMPFTVPPNLYIIGTMNTADRSAEPLDTALRRRFTFVEMPPDYALLEAKFGTDTVPNVARLLRAMNQRISKLLGKEYAIGHAYFLGLNQVSDTPALKRIFQNRLIPLLQEYFYGNAGKVELVIGEDFFEKPWGLSGRASLPDPDWAPSRYEVREDLADYQSYPLRQVFEMPDDLFIKALVRIYQR